MDDISNKPLRQIVRTLTFKQLGGILSFLVTCLGGAYSAGHWVSSRSSDIDRLAISQELGKCEAKWEAIAPSVDIHSEYDIRNIIVPGLTTTIPEGTELLGDGIIGIRQLPRAEFTTKELREIVFGRDATNQSEIDRIFFDDTRAYIWTFPDSFEITLRKGTVTEIPYIMAYKISLPALRNKMAQAIQTMSKDRKIQWMARAACENPESSYAKLDVTAAILTGYAERLQQSDIPTIGYLFVQFVNLLNVLANPDLHWQSLSTEKDQGIISFQNLFVYKNVSVRAGGKALATTEFYAREQVLLLTHGSNLYFIKIRIPSPEFGGFQQYKTIINQWIANLRIQKEL